jgi:iron(III) transport system substrate-binding protein
MPFVKLRRTAVSSAVIGIVVVVVLVVAGAGGFYAGQSMASTSGSTTTVTQTGSGGAASTVTVTSTVSGGAAGLPQDLITACKAEGATTTMYGVYPAAVAPKLTGFINQAFPWMKFNYVGLAPADEVTKATSEFQAGHVTADILQQSVGLIVEENASGLIQPFVNPLETLQNFSSSWLDPAGYIHPGSYSIIFVAYNTNAIKNTSILPKAWTDLANPIWKGKMAIDNPTLVNVAGEAFADLEPAMGNSSWTQFLKGVEANNPTLTASANLALTDLTTGQAQIAVVLSNTFITAAKQGAPVAAVPGLPVYVLWSPMALAKNAPQPACGELVIEWFSSIAGQSAMALLGPYVPTLNDVVNSFPTTFSLVLTPTTTVVPYTETPATFLTNPQSWAKYYNTIFGGLS